MIKIENHCCGCAAPGYPCLGNSCPNRRVEVIYCDACHNEIFANDLVIDGDRHYHIGCYEEDAE